MRDPLRDFVRPTDLWPPRLWARWRCHRDLQRCQHTDRPNDNTHPTWITRLSLWLSREDPADYGY